MHSFEPMAITVFTGVNKMPECTSSVGKFRRHVKGNYYAGIKGTCKLSPPILWTRFVGRHSSLSAAWFPWEKCQAQRPLADWIGNKLKLFLRKHVKEEVKMKEGREWVRWIFRCWRDEDEKLTFVFFPRKWSMVKNGNERSTNYYCNWHYDCLDLSRASVMSWVDATWWVSRG